MSDNPAGQSEVEEGQRALHAGLREDGQRVPHRGQALSRMTTYRLEPAGLMDRTDPRVLKHAGASVKKVQPHGCPRNGTMGMCYVERIDNGEFIGLVSLASLTKEKTRS